MQRIQQMQKMEIKEEKGRMKKKLTGMKPRRGILK
jgi:hypothetical protein